MVFIALSRAFTLFTLTTFMLKCFCVHDSMNFILKPMERECFYEDFDGNSPVRTIDAFVQAGGNVAVLLTIHGPLELSDIRSGHFEDPLVTETIDVAKESESETLSFTMDFKPKSSGTYAICLDNRSSRFLPKIVQLDVRLAPRPEPSVVKKKKKTSKGKGNSEGEEEGEEEEDSVEEKDEAELVRVKESMSRIRKGLVKIQLQQQRDRHRLALHSQTNRVSHKHVVIGSVVETAFFIAAAIFQICFVRRWFTSKTLLPTTSTPMKAGKEWA